VDLSRSNTAVVLGDGWLQLLAKGDGVSLADLRAREAELDFDRPINIQ
jgi:hypothetical protein